MSQLILRPATPADVSVLFNLIVALAEYEKLTHAVTGSIEALEKHLFGTTRYIEAIVAEYSGKVVGFALFFHNYSTFLAKPGIYLEDLFVLPEFRRLGIGKAILSYLAQLTIERKCGRFEWSVLDWNENAISLYKNMGASILEQTRICRLTAQPLTELAAKPSSKIRHATAEDLPALWQLLHHKAEFDKKLDISATPEALKEHLFGQPNYLAAIVAESEAEIVGFASFFYNYSTFLTKPGLYIDDLFILPLHRRQGLGKAMLGYLAQLAIKRDCGRLEWLVAVWNENAKAFYQRLGAIILPEWRICRVTEDKLSQLAAKSQL
ncbi:MAG: GNAT family N-acetyltransferase [Coleofasciculaceae cyanobacterium]